MRKRLLALALTICMVLALWPTNVGAADIEMTSCGVMDTINANYNTGTTKTVARMTDGVSGNFRYTVPTNGATVLIFFKADACTYSKFLIQSIAQSDWLHNDEVDVIAVESMNASKSVTEEFMTESAGEGWESDFTVYYMGNALLYAYRSMLGLSGSIIFPFVLIITEDGARNYVQYYGTQVTDAAICGNALAAVVSTVNNTDIVTVDVMGTKEYQYVREELDSINSYRGQDGKSELELDKTLTEYAMLRAAESALYYSHTRPNGDEFSSGMALSGPTYLS